MSQEKLTAAEHRIILLVRQLKPYDTIDISLTKDTSPKLQIICRNTLKEVFPFSSE